MAINDRQTLNAEEDRTLVENKKGGESGGRGEVTPVGSATPTATPTATPVSSSSTRPYSSEYTTKEDSFTPDWGAGSGETVPPRGATPPVTDDPVVDQPTTPTETEGVDTRKTIERMIQDPTSVLEDKRLQQQYTQLEIAEGEIQDPTSNQLGALGPLDAQTVEAPETVETQEIVAGEVETRQLETQEAQASNAVAVAEVRASLIAPEELTKAVDEIGKLDPMKAASMASHLDGLLEGMESGNVPMWARPAVAQVEQMLSSRGISASSIGRDSLFNAIIQSAMPIAQQDATFEQDAHKVNYQAKVQAVMSDVSMEFAAKQFNATSKNQIAQFNTQLQSQVALQNAARIDNMRQFNAQLVQAGSQFNIQTAQEAERFNVQTALTADQFNVQTSMAAQQFNVQTSQANEQFNASQVNSMTQMQAQLQSQRDQFNAQMATQIEQSNVNWRRQVNQANTAGINAVNQANVQNAFNLSNQGLTFLWQEMRDEAHWDFQASQADLDRKNQLEASILANETALGGEIGKTLETVIQGGNFLSSFLDSWGD